MVKTNIVLHRYEENIYVLEVPVIPNSGKARVIGLLERMIGKELPSSEPLPRVARLRAQNQMGDYVKYCLLTHEKAAEVMKSYIRNGD